MMAINFCKHIFRPAIRCDTVSVDGYEVENLVAENRSAFLSESFVKPPINIYVSLPCNVDIARIIIQSAHGAQRSCGFEIFTQCHPITSSWLLPVDVKPKKTDHANILAYVGKSYQTESSLFRFENPRFRHRFAELGSASVGNKGNGDAIAATLSHRYPQHLSNVSEVCIRIMRAVNSGVCAIGWLEIWGQPAYGCSAPIISKVLKLHRQSMGTVSQHLVKNPTTIDSNNAVKSEMSGKHSDNIPHEFLDVITQQIMCVPMLLPSGHSVDHSTIDRHGLEEQRWGRAPSDPFTGVPFSADVVPVFDVALKACIDRFLLLNGNCDLPNGRTVCDARHSARSVSRLVTERASSNGGNIKTGTCVPTKSRTIDNLNKKCEKNTNSSFDVSLVEKKWEVIQRTAHRSDAMQKITEQRKRKTLSDSANDPVANTSSKHSKLENNAISPLCTHANSHERNIRSSLQCALNATLGGLPSFRRAVGISTPDVTACGECSNQTEGVSRYRLSCQHWVCRQCVLKHDGHIVYCSKCHKPTARAEIVRIHNS